MVSCAACGCSQTKNTKEQGITFHKFPANPEKQRVWIKVANKSDWHPGNRSYLCSQHFTADCFDRSSALKVRLRDGAVPTRQIRRLKYVRTPYPLPTSTSIEADRPSMSSPIPSTSFERPLTPPPQILTKDATSVDTPRKLRLKRRVDQLTQANVLQVKRIKLLQHRMWRQRKQISSLKSIIKDLQNKNLLKGENAGTIWDNFGNNKDLIQRLFNKSTGKKVTRKYNQAIRTFAVTLHFFSPKAYRYVRERFCNSLPHTKTLSKWYSTINAEPGFSKEVLNMLCLKAKYSERQVVCSLVFDEMAIRKHVEYDGKRYHGYVNFGNGIHDETMDVAQEALVFMVVAINDTWKVPVGYFFIKSVDSVQKAELVTQCLSLLTETGIVICNLTFDGCPTNFSMCSVLGCILDPENIQTKLSNYDVCVLPDPSHMIKLVRNTFGERQVLFDMDMNEINFKYLHSLNNIQETEGLHLANKLRKQHLFFFKQKMRVKLATQLLSRSVTEALLFCKMQLNLKEFSGCEPTAKFILLMNDAFDILNSRRYYSEGYKKALCKDNIASIKLFAQNFTHYVKGLKFSDGKLVLQSNRKTGFLGFIVCFSSIVKLYDNFIDTELLRYLPLYKCSQDHIELFFGGVRSHGGYNNNPTCRQFKSAFKKILIHAEVRDGGLGNCVPLQQINILNVSSTTSPEIIINNSNVNYHNVDVHNESPHNLNDHAYALDGATTVTEFSNEIITYISGFVAFKLGKTLKCEICVSALFGSGKSLLNSFISVKNRGGLTWPSKDVIQICKTAERFIREQSGRIIKERISFHILNCFLETPLFKDISDHSSDLSILEQHVPLLVKSVSNCYCDTRIHYMCKRISQTPTENIRNMYTKLILFKGQ